MLSSLLRFYVLQTIHEKLTHRIYVTFFNFRHMTQQTKLMCFNFAIGNCMTQILYIACVFPGVV